MIQVKRNAPFGPNESHRARSNGAMTDVRMADPDGPMTCTNEEPFHRENSIILDLSPQEAQILKAEANRCPHNPFDERQLELFLREARIRFGNFPERIRRQIVNFAMDGNLDGALLIRGFCQDPDLPTTPTASKVAVCKDTFLSEFHMASVGMTLGEMVGYSQEKDGAFWQSINPTKCHESKQTSESSNALLMFHTEVTFHPHMPAYVLLYGLRQDPERKARTIIASIRRFHRLLPLRTREILFQALFKTSIDPSFGNEEDLAGTGPVLSVLYGDPEDPFFRYDLDLMIGQTPEARTALRDLQLWVNKIKVEFTIEPGSLLIVDNRRTVHSRSSFQAHYDGRDRWLERVSVVKDLTPSLSDRAAHSRIINTDFSAYIGN